MDFESMGVDIKTRDGAYIALGLATEGMDLPDFRRDDPRWLVKHLAGRNSEHKNYGVALGLAKGLIAKGWVR